MKRFWIALPAFAAAMAVAGGVHASSASDAFGNCLVASSTGKDRIVVMQWFFIALSVNPSVQTFSNATSAQRDEATRRPASVLERLVFVDCHAEAVTAVKQDGAQAIEMSFEVFGRSAASELMSNPAVTKEMSSIASYTDNEKWAQLTAEANK